MKAFKFTPLHLFAQCILVILMHGILLQIMVHSRIIEKLMSLNFSWWELLLIMAFVIIRIANYLMVPATLAGLAVYLPLRYFLKKNSSNPL
ncbi:MAG: hypothetical protein ABIP97_01700 [Chthoniobacterales bacterium]